MVPDIWDTPGSRELLKKKKMKIRKILSLDSKAPETPVE